MDEKKTKNLIFDKRFWPIFWTQFFGAFNDNVFKNALVILITFNSYSLLELAPEQMVAICGGIFILPFFLFSAISGQICDKFPKDKLIRFVKIWEIVVMLFGAVGFMTQNVNLLLGTLFFMGLQSTVFGPVKYSILPELIDDDELVNGNALVSSGTFVSILLGTILGGALISLPEIGKLYTGVCVIILAIIGAIFGFKVDALAAADKKIKVHLGLIKPIWKITKITMKKKSVFLAVLGISWFWFLGAALLSMFPVYGKDILGGNENVVTLFLAMFSIGVGFGSILCERFSKKRLELGLVPFGTIGISLFVADLFFIGNPNLNLLDIGIMEFISFGVHQRILLDLFGLSVFSGFFIVPLYTFIQLNSGEGERSQVIAGLNIINALFMVLSAIILTLLYSFGFSVVEIFGFLALLNAVVSLYIYNVVSEFYLRFCAMILTRILYRLKVTNEHFIPESGPCIIVCNHISFIDWLVVSAGVRRPMRFVMYYKFMKIPIIKYLFRDAKVIPIAGKNEDEKILEKAMSDISNSLKEGELICIFPEGQISSDGELSPFKRGIEKILESATDVEVVPIYLEGLWGSYFSRKYNGKALSHNMRFFERWFTKISLTVYAPWKQEDVTAEKLENFYKKIITD